MSYSNNNNNRTWIVWIAILIIGWIGPLQAYDEFPALRVTLSWKLKLKSARRSRNHGIASTPKPMDTVIIGSKLIDEIDTPPLSKKKKFFIPQVLMGGVSRSVAQMTLYPMDALRTLAQTRDGRTLADVGVKALVRGCATTSSFALVMGSLQFSVYEALRDKQVGPVLASAAGAISSCVVSVPQEVIKQRLVTGVYSSFRQAVSTIYSTQGIPGFYHSWKPTMARNVPFVMTTFVTMDALKTRRLRDRGGDGELPLLSLPENLIIGMSSALVAGLLTNPMDVVKTRMITQAASNQVPYSSSLDCLTTILRKEGPFTLYAGIKQRSVYMCSLWGLTFALNGKLKDHFGKSP